MADITEIAEKLKKGLKSKSKRIEHKWNEEEVNQLILEVEKRPVIWDFWRTDYKIGPKREAAWQEIAEILPNSIPCAELVAKWQNLRGQMRKEFIKIKTTKSGQSAERYKPSWKYFAAMRFVTDHEGEHTTISESNIDTFV